MNFKNMLDIFTWKPEKEYDFVLPDVSESNSNNYNTDKNSNIQINIYPNISSNLEYIKYKYNYLINSDIIIREFSLYVRDKEYRAFLIFIDGMVDSNLINDFILNPLMLKNIANSFNFEKQIISETKTDKVTIRKIKKINISEYILDKLLPQNSVSKKDKFEDIISGINSGDCALFIDTLNIAFDIDVKGFKQRGVDAHNNEVVIKGPQEAFVENIRTNTSLLRRIINSEDLIIETIDVGSITKTRCSVCYMDNIANNDLVAEVKYRINNLKVDSILSSRAIGRINYRWESNWRS